MQRRERENETAAFGTGVREGGEGDDVHAHFVVV